ncbi:MULTISPECIES: class I SAM-dependent methyltransferase [unclassified Streptomyces]|uniref:methyltransferase n=1 Tax=unclassified Streptomyces TaxID=2593676 RepID=UPI00036C3909|nr:MULTISPECIES: class I SAM-dependent methyltransferase [unclassified Streptomyces]MYX39004.1 methyltransferase [Streptomyces sp. SID8377]
MRIPNEVLAVLTDRRTVINRDRVQIPFPLDRPVYDQVNRILKEFGGRWDGRQKVRAHVFPYLIEDFMRQSLLLGEFPSKQDEGWFPTPPAVVEEILTLAGIHQGVTVLEPSAGAGAIAGPAAARGAVVDCVEINERRAQVLREHSGARRVRHADFLQLDPLDYETGFDRVLMNPPFHSGLDHIRHAMGFLGEDALLVAVMSAGITWWTDRKSTELRELIEEANGEFIPLPDDAFAESGANVRTVLVTAETWPGRRRVLPDHAWHRAQPRQLDLFAA